MAATTVSSNSTKISSKILRERIRGGLYGIFVADALSMPVHWYYDTDDIREDFGQITTYHAPKKRHPSSIMNLSNTSGGGRGYSSNAKNEIVGSVILHDKRKFWGVPQTHYHQGMKAGENTLNALCARVAMRSVIENGLKYEPKKFLEHYVKFMTTPGSHNDTYAESYHRDFFVNYAKGLPLDQCCGEETHNTPSVGGFVTLPPVLYASILEQVRKQEQAYQQSAEKKEDVEVEITEEMRKQAVQTTLAHLALTHKGKTIASYARVYCNIMLDALLGKNLRKSIEDVGKSELKIDFKQMYEKNYLDTEIAGNKFTIACYIDGSLPIVLYLAYKYHDNFDKAIIANTNVGGENCHRGSALGALLGTYLSISAISDQKWIKPLVHHSQIEQEVKDFLQ